MFEWQRHSQDESDAPHFDRLLKFLDLKAQASESFVPGTQKRQAQPKPTVQLRSAYTTNVSSTCNICGAPKHPMFMCRKFKSLSCEHCINIMRCALIALKQDISNNNVYRVRNAKSVEKHNIHVICYINFLVLILELVHHRPILAFKEGPLSLAATNSPSTHLSQLSHPKVSSQSQSFSWHVE